jgi:integrase
MGCRMSRTSKGSLPSYRHKKSHDQAVVTLTDPSGARHDVLLGKFNSPESRTEYLRVLGEWEARGRTLAKSNARTPDLTVNEMLVLFWDHVERHYRLPDGTPTSEQNNFKYAIRALRELYGYTLAAQFGPLSLKTVRQRFVDSGLCRSEVNRRTQKIRQAFKWAVSEELIPPTVYHGLQAVDGLKKGRCAAKDHEPIGPVADEDVDKTLPHLNKHARSMVQLQRLTGMRPGEVCALRKQDVDTSGDVWSYIPPHHKMAHTGRQRIVMIGPRAQVILAPTLADIGPQDHVFSPRRMWEAKRLLMREQRKSSIPPSQQNRRKPKPKRIPAESYDTSAYYHAVQRACEKAGVTPWHPNQLRHTMATKTRKQFGLEGVQVLLGHARADVTQVYAERDESLALRLAAEIG